VGPSLSSSWGNSWLTTWGVSWGIVVTSKIIKIRSAISDDIRCESDLVSPIIMRSKLLDDIKMKSVIR